MTDEPDLTVADVAERLRLTRDTVTARLRDGTIPGGYQLTPGGRWRVRDRDFTQWHQRLTGQYVPPIPEYERLEPPSPTSRRRIGGAR